MAGTTVALEDKISAREYDKFRIDGEHNNAEVTGVSIAVQPEVNGLPLSDSNAVPVSVKSVPVLTFETDSVILLNDISRKLSILIQYEAMLHKIDLEEEI